MYNNYNVSRLSSLYSYHWSESQGQDPESCWVVHYLMGLWVLVLMGSGDEIPELHPEHVLGLGWISTMFPLLCPHIPSNRLDSRVPCFPRNICPSLSWESHWLHTRYHCQSLLEVAGVGCVVEMGLVVLVLVGICGRQGGQSGNDPVGEGWTSVTWGLQLLRMDQGSSWKVSSMVRWCGSIWLWHRLDRLFSTGVPVSNVHLHISGNIPGLSQCSVSTPYAGHPSLIWSIVPLWRILVHSVPPQGLGDTLC